MTMRIDTKPLQRGLSTVIRALGGRDGIESHVLLKAKGESLFLTCVSPAMSITTRIAVRSDQDTAFTMPARKLLDIARKHNDDDIWSIRFDDTKVRITVGRTRYTLHTLAAEEFPKPDFLGKEHTAFVVDSIHLADLISSVMPSAAKNDVRVALNSVNLTVTSESLCAVATDGHRLSHAVRTATVGTSGTSSLNIILPRAVAAEVASLGSPEVAANVAVKDSHIQIRIGDTFVNARVISDRYPDWQRVMPEKFSGEIVVDRERFENLLKTVSAVVDENKRGVYVRAKDGALTVETPDTSSHSASVSIDIQQSVRDLQSSFNIDYLIDAVEGFQADALCMKFGADDAPSMFHPAGMDTGLRTIVMPVRA